jgi:hypothetical protein
MKTTLTKILPGMMVLLACATGVSQAQQEAQPRPQSPLGSPAETAGRYSANYAEAARSALPKADLALLNKLVSEIREAAAAEKPLAVTDLRQMERLFGLRERGEADASGYIDAGEAVYKVDAKRQRIYLARRYAVVQPVTRQEFARELEAIRASHFSLAERLGIPKQEVLFTDFREVLSQTDGHPVLEKSVQGPIQAEGAVTTILRSVGGVLVEGSYARLSSLDAKRLDLVDVRWPMVRLSEPALRKGLRAPQETLEPIVKRVAAESKSQAVNVRMAIVLRPISAEAQNSTFEFVLSLKVGVEPQSVKNHDGYRTDAGEVFYVDLIRDAPPFAETPAHDTVQSGYPQKDK